MKLKVWGSRGSIPIPALPKNVEKTTNSVLLGFFKAGYRKVSDIKPFLKRLSRKNFGGYGGNTLCIEVKTPKQSVIIDSGSGIRLLGYDLMQGECGRGQGEVHIFYTHFHWDHLTGLPFFIPLFIPGNKIHVYAVQNDLKEVFKTIFRRPYFPLELKDLAAQIIYHKLKPRQPCRLQDLIMTPYRLDHPDPCWGFKAEYQNNTYSHCVDTEAKRITEAALGPDLPLYQKIDLLMFDAQYTTIEKYEKVDWGHASACLGIDLALRYGIKRLAFVHHNPASSNHEIWEANREAINYYQVRKNMAAERGLAFQDIDLFYTYDGMELDI